MNKVKLGFFAFSGLGDPKEHRNFNEWHHLDHVVENRALPGIAHGERWACTPDCMKVRYVGDPSAAGLRYMTLYLLMDPINRSLKDFLDLGAQLRAIGRWDRTRQRHLGGPFMLAKAYASPRVLVSPGSIPYRPTKGVFVTITDALDPKQQDAVAQWYDQTHIPDMLTVRGVAGVYWFTSQSFAISDARFANPPGRVIRVWYLDDDPIAMVEDMRKKVPQWQATGRMMDLSKAVKTIYAGPFRTIFPFQYDFADEMAKADAATMSSRTEAASPRGGQ